MSINLNSIEKNLRKAKSFISNGKLQEAEKIYKEILLKYPKNLRAKAGINIISTKKNNLGNNELLNKNIRELISFYNGGNFKQAIQNGEKLLLTNKNSGIIFNILGASYAATKNFEKSLNAYKHAIDLEPKNPQIYNNLGTTLRQKGNLKGSIINFKKAINLKKDFTEAYSNLASAIKEGGDKKKALRLFDEAIKINPNHSQSYYNKANTLNEIGDYEQAIKNYKKAIEINENYSEAYNNLGAVYNTLKKYENAVESIQKAIQITPDYYDAYNNLGSAQTNINRDEDAIKSYKKSIELNPLFSDAYSNLCALYEKANRIDDFEKFINLAMHKINIEDQNLLYRRAQLASRKKQYETAKNHLEMINPDKVSNMIKVGSSELLGKTYDKLNEYSSAFGSFQNTNYLVKTNIVNKQFDPKKYRIEISNLLKSFNNKKEINWNSNIIDNKITPIFLVGFPRSGTTLLDTILSSHPNIVTLEEKPMVANMKINLGKIASVENLEKLDNKKINELKKVYFEELNKHIKLDDKKQIFIDKLPLNIVDIGLIIRVFPKAKFIFSLRHPCDCVLSCFMQSFNLNNAMANFLDLEDSAKLYDLVMNLWCVYESKLNLNYHIIKYEDLVNNLKDASSALLNSIDLSWNDNLINFQETALSKKINTPSYNQVTEELYTRASGRWKNYRKELSPVLPMLEKWVEKWKY